jgi:oxygen-independent coproporphyrinogen-3 oxidase
MEIEMELRFPYLQNEIIDTIYVGGGTPSLLNTEQLKGIFYKISSFYPIANDCEITIEANPDDLSSEFLKKLRTETPVNRLSIGIQSFYDQHLRLLNRRHSADQALNCIELAREEGFTNISIDLIYGIPGMTLTEWTSNLKYAADLEHLSAYHLTIEPGTALEKLAKRGLINIAGEEESSCQFEVLLDITRKNGFIHYEISNLGKEGFFSRHNTNYWKQKKYLGLGPSAHSYDIISRQWNVPHVKQYIEALHCGKVYFESEKLSVNNRYNEYLMVSLRTMWGVDQKKVEAELGEKFSEHLNESIKTYIRSGHIHQENSFFKMTKKGWLISDYILKNLMI